MTGSRIASDTPAHAFGSQWWAHELGRGEIIETLRAIGVSDQLRDRDGFLPAELADEDHDEF